MHRFLEHIAINLIRCVSIALIGASSFGMMFLASPLVTAVFAIVGYYPPIKSDTAWCFLIGILAFGPTIFCFVVFPLGEKLLDYQIGGRRPSDREKVILNAIHERLCSAAKDKRLSLPRITFRVQDTSEINAFAYGRSRIMFTSTMLRHYLKDENGLEKLSAIAAHEAGHLRNGDGGFGMVGSILIGPFNAMLALLNNTFGKIPLISLFNYALCLVISIPIFFGTLIDQIIQQPIEYRADDFAARLMGAEKFAEALSEIAKEDEWRGGGVFATMKRSHPASELRRNRILKRHGLEDASLDISGLTA